MESNPRQILLQSLARDLVGPQGAEDESIAAWPTDQYITGILYPVTRDPNQEDDEDRDAAADGDGSPGESIPMSSMRRPTLMGLSFSIDGEKPRVRVKGCAARYLPTAIEPPPAPPTHPYRWKRDAVDIGGEFDIREGLYATDAADGLRWWVRGTRTAASWQATIVLENHSEPEVGRLDVERATWFQVGFAVDPVSGSRVIARPTARPRTDDDSESAELIYRASREWAVGHTCAADWTLNANGAEIRTTWLPAHVVSAVDPSGNVRFREESAAVAGTADGAFDAEALAAERQPARLVELLRVAPTAYGKWLDGVAATIDRLAADRALDAALAARARRHVAAARAVIDRMNAGIARIESEATTRRCFQLSQRAMLTQRRWAKRDPKARLVWRPFQIGFILMTLEGIATPKADGRVTEARRTLDLLWFPTGGGKTEAYLALSAFTLFLRRLREPRPDDGAGVSVLMRYTLRLLTVQQFERASRLVLACERIRRDGAATGDASMGSVPFSIGLWVGSGATPNEAKDARDSEEERAKAQQLARCPCCGEATLDWDPKRRGSYFVFCRSAACHFGREEQPLPVWTIDSEVYRERPSMVIGTIDKFAQVVRRKDTRRLLDPGGRPPELIIQDELHLISGPLGTVAGLYEAATDLICERDGVPPKIIGSTATIRRAEEQVRGLFNRRVVQFPPPVLDADDSCFSVVDSNAAGRLYVGCTTVGRSPKFVLQASCASLLQCGVESALAPAARDPYWTLITYFNSLRELGGALVMMQDDVPDSIGNFARLHAQPSRVLDEPVELTSRVEQAEIPRRLVDLERPYDPARPADKQTAISVVLATNMISVGVDVPRLGLMVVNGQPKTMSEYIQATSRVGRGDVAGLVLTVYNAGRPRDRSHFEAFRTWHQTLYREVEATSVTPFAPRARDRALHAAIVALARHCVPGMLEDPELTPQRRQALEQLVDEVVSRSREVDPSEEAGVRADASRYLDEWQSRDALPSYWNDAKPRESLLVSAEVVATAKATRGDWREAARGTLNSMRDVEPEVAFRMVGRLRNRSEANDA